MKKQFEIICWPKLNIEIDYRKFENDQLWDGLKGYVTNTSLSPDQIIEGYNNLWKIEKAFYGKLYITLLKNSNCFMANQLINE